MNKEQLKAIFHEQQESQRRLHEDFQDVILQTARTIYECLRQGHTVFLFGNGGSASDAQHVAAEMVGRFTRERKAYPAMALTTDTSILTAVGNDYGFDKVFVRQLEAFARPGDLAVGISTSGNSPNVLTALEWAKKSSVSTIGFSGNSGGKMADLCDTCFVAPSTVTARIQEMHIAAWHAICDLVEQDLVESGN